MPCMAPACAGRTHPPERIDAASTFEAARNDLKPSIGLVTHLNARRSCSAVRRTSTVPSFRVDGTVAILPDALDLDVGLVHSPRGSRLALVFA